MGKQAQLAHELFGVIPLALLQALNLEVMSLEVLILEMFTKGVGQTTLAAAWDTCDKDHRDQTVRLINVTLEFFGKLKHSVLKRVC